jgi:hypothetical protein
MLKTMKHAIRIALFAGLIFGVLQFIPIGRTTSAHSNSSDGGSHLIKIRNPEVAQILNRSCADCHSSQASLPWYGQVAPVSWLIKRHMDHGIKKLDVAVWETRKPLHGEMEDICDAVSNRDMPLRSYTFMHPDTKLSDHDIDLVCNWASSPAQETTQVH